MKYALKNTPLLTAPTGYAQTPEELMQALRSIRGWMLAETDWTQANDSPLSDLDRQAWRTWRQELRDITTLINVDNVQDWFEITDPPTTGRPSTWVNWEHANYDMMLAAMVSRMQEHQLSDEEL